MDRTDNEKIGRFVADLRRAKGMTQLELAGQLFVSDKTVSKWERGLSMPGVDLLTPLADALGVTVAELLRGERIDNKRPLDAEEVKQLVTASLDLSVQSGLHRNRRHWVLAFFLALALVLAELCLLLWLGFPVAALDTGVLLFSGLMLFFGGWFCCFAKDVLPRYYDENKISAFSQGPFRMNMIGIHFNNRNWPHICNAVRIYTLGTAVLYPAVWLLLCRFSGTADTGGIAIFLTFALMLGLFVPIYYMGRKYK